MEPFRNRIVMGMLTNDDTEVLEDGRIIVEMDSPSEYQTGKFIEVALQVTPSSQTKELEEIYGEKGENFTGPLVYRYYERACHKEWANSYIVLRCGNKREVGL